MKSVPPASRFTTLLLDLDGTLLDVEMSSFLEAFFTLVAPRFGPPAQAGRVFRAMREAAGAMMLARDGARTVDLVFLDAFAPAVGSTPEAAREAFAACYRDEFESLRRLVRPLPGARGLVDRALAQGYELVLASNPVFFLEPIRSRARWAGVGDVPFTLVTGAELMCWTKPHAGYYEQVLEMTGRRPGQCLMIGDDPRMDMAAKEVGMATWLAVPEGAAPREAPLADRRGTLAQMTGWL